MANNNCSRIVGTRKSRKGKLKRHHRVVAPDLKVNFPFRTSNCQLATASLQDARPPLPIRKLDSSGAEIKGRGKSCMTGIRAMAEGGMGSTTNDYPRLIWFLIFGRGWAYIGCNCGLPVDNTTPPILAPGTRNPRITYRSLCFDPTAAVCRSHYCLYDG